MKLLTLWGPVVLIMALIFVLSSSSDPMAPPGGISDKTAHFLAYATLGAAMMRALAGGRSSSMTVPRVALAALLTALYGLSDEIHQALVPDRSPELWDLVADAAGGLAGAAACALAARAVRRIRRT